MSREEVFNAAAGMMMMYGNFLKEVAEEIGMERTVALHKRHGESTGAMIVNELQKLEGFNTEALGAIMDQMYRPMGIINIEFEAAPDSLVVKNGMCPIYTGWKIAGLDDETIDKLCINREGAVNAAISEAFPEVTARHTRRTKPEGYCTIVYNVEK
ncbi:MAG: hypothetical protein NWE75_01930 [Candidatus Bathyarchaeota archaeon]|nr:hypothetical protein [Candidatus Bathyarchaeota archaeon]